MIETITGGPPDVRLVSWNLLGISIIDLDVWPCRATRYNVATRVSVRDMIKQDRRRGSVDKWHGYRIHLWPTHLQNAAAASASSREPLYLLYLAAHL